MQADEALAKDHYEEHTDKPFFGELVYFITGGPLVAMMLEGRTHHRGPSADRRDQPARGRRRVDPRRVRHRGDLQPVHGFDSPESAQREISLWFPEL